MQAPAIEPYYTQALGMIAWSQNLVDSVLLNVERFWRTTFGSWRKIVSAAKIFRARKMGTAGEWYPYTPPRRQPPLNGSLHS